MERRKFIPRFSAPSHDDENYYSNRNHLNSIEPMPNCTTYVVGRLLELVGIDYKELDGDAKTFYEKAKKCGLEVGQEPKLGAIAVWDEVNGYGHVAPVEEIFGNKDFNSSNSAWGGEEFYMRRVTKASGYKYTPSKPFIGFIYCGIEFESSNDDLSSNAIPNRFKVVNKDGKQIAAYTNYSYACKFADTNNAIIIDSVNATQVYPTNKEDEKPDAIIPPTSESEDFNNNTIENRFKVVNKDGKQIGAYTKYSYACETAKNNNAVVIDSVNGKQVYPSESVKEELTATSYPDYTDGSTYKVMLKPNEWKTSKGAFSIWKNAFNKWSTCKNEGYHIYDKNGNQLD